MLDALAFQFPAELPGWSIIPASSPVHSHRCVLAESVGGRLFRCAALAGQSFATPKQIKPATDVTTARL
jgi:hypothetical protein